MAFKIPKKRMGEIEEQVEKLNSTAVEMNAQIEEIRGEIENLISFKRWNELKEKYTSVREALYAQIEDEVNHFSDQFDQKSEWFQESDRGSQAQDWIDEWDGFKDGLPETEFLEIEIEIDVEEVEEVDIPVGDSKEY